MNQATFIRLIVFLFFSCSSEAAVRYVKADGSCNFGYRTVSAALAAGIGNTDIRIVGDIRDNITINRSVSISGGWPTCASAASTGTSQITGIDDNTKPTIKVQQVSGNFPNQVSLTDLYLTGGSGGVGQINNSNGGGLAIIGGRQNVVATHVEIAGNRSWNAGGGVTVNNGATLELINSPIYLNTATNKGGGLYCKNSNVTASGNSVIVKNTVTEISEPPNTQVFGVGGGVYLENCDFTYRANAGHTIFGESFKGISYNEATIDGAGIYFSSTILEDIGGSDRFTEHIPTNMSIGTLALNSSDPVEISHNIITNGPTTSNSSAIANVIIEPSENAYQSCGFWIDWGTGRECIELNHISLKNVEITHNSGGRYVVEMGPFSQLEMDCNGIQNKLCNVIRDNNSDSNERDSAIIQTTMRTPHYDHILDDVKHIISGTRIFNNTAGRIFNSDQYTSNFWNGQEFPLLISDYQTSLTVDRSLIHNNNINTLAVASNRANVYFQHVTIADNNYVNEPLSQYVFINSLSHPGDTVRPNSAFEVRASIITETDTSLLGITSGSDNIIFDCVMYSGGLTATTIEVDSFQGQDASFVNPTQNNYRLQPGSAAVDKCDVFPGSSDLDIDGEVRWDDPLTINGDGSAMTINYTLDLGADELHHNLASDLIFKDGFE